MEATLNPNLNQLVAMFISEILHSRRTSLRRASEISSRVISLLPRMKTEEDILNVLTDVEKEFDEVTSLKQALNFGYHHSDVKVYEKEIKQYASRLFLKDMDKSSAFLSDASQPGMNIQELCIKYPEFCHYLFEYTDKGQLLPELRQAVN